MDDLERLSKALRRADEQASKVRAELTAVIYAALDSGMTQAEVARRTGFSREWLRKLAARRSR